MAHSKRASLMERYFEAMDTTETADIREALTSDFTYIAGDGTTFSGLDAIDRYIDTVRTLADTTHAIEHQAHGDSASFAEGTVSGIGPDGSEVAVGFCDVFEFDDADETLHQITVYINER